MACPSPAGLDGLLPCADERLSDLSIPASHDRTLAWRLMRRSQRRRLTWTRMKTIADRYLPFPRIPSRRERRSRLRRRADRGGPMKGFALAEARGGLTLAYSTDWPTSFWITALFGMVFSVGSDGIA